VIDIDKEDDNYNSFEGEIGWSNYWVLKTDVIIMSQGCLKKPSLTGIEHNIVGIHLKSAQPKHTALVLQVEC
jgi:hypothetical protein